jgi:hypothetical protein
MGAECEHVTFEHELYFNISQNKHGINLSCRLGGNERWFNLLLVYYEQKGTKQGIFLPFWNALMVCNSIMFEMEFI